MKSRIQQVCALLLAFAALGFFTGCTSVSEHGARTLGQTRDDIDWAMTRYQNRVTFGFVTPTLMQQVSVAYKAYQTAFNEAAQKADMDYNTPTPDNVKQLADQLLLALSSIP